MITMTEDTIAALATPPGEAGIAVLRMSGAEALPILQEIFVGKKKSKIGEIKDRYVHYGYILDRGKEVLDEVLVIYMAAPRTYTREDVVEIHCHGGMIPVRRILDLLLTYGARLAEPGEFTKRAFLNGRIDLAQAEGVMDLIASKSEESAKASLEQMEGLLSRKINDMRHSILNLLAHIEVTIDYPEEDIEAVLLEQIQHTLLDLKETCRELLSSADQGRLIREGIKTVIIGKPNVGKSSLLNALVGQERAIVTDIPGTTRDMIEEYIDVRGILVRIIDTAGIRETIDLVEKIGVQRSRELIKDADLILLLFDASQPLEEEDFQILDWLEGKRVLILLNKIDRQLQIEDHTIQKLQQRNDVIKTSMTDRLGIEEIEKYIAGLVYAGKVSPKNALMITNSRHKQALIKAEKHLTEAVAAIDQSIPLDLVTIDIRNTWDALGEITGESLTENLIDKIFMDFCLGK